jgi:hypothetical protein
MHPFHLLNIQAAKEMTELANAAAAEDAWYLFVLQSRLEKLAVVIGTLTVAMGTLTVAMGTLNVAMGTLTVAMGTQKKSTTSMSGFQSRLPMFTKITLHHSPARSSHTFYQFRGSAPRVIGMKSCRRAIFRFEVACAFRFSRDFVVVS